jgi:co-chaperonin GroES (HSP10)
MISAEVLESSRVKAGCVLIKPQRAAETTENGLYLSDLTERRQTHGQVLVIGEGVSEVQTGDWVLFLRWAGEHFEIEDHSDYVLVRKDDIQAVFDGDRLIPVGKWVVLACIDDRVKSLSSGILIADTGWLHSHAGNDFEGEDQRVEYDPPDKADVLAVGPSCADISPDQRVVIDRWVGTEVSYGGNDYLITQESAVLAVLESE